MPKPQPKQKPRLRPAPVDDLPGAPGTTAVNPNLQSRSFNILRDALDRMEGMSPTEEGSPIVLHGSEAQAYEAPASETYEDCEDYAPPEVYVPPEERNDVYVDANEADHSTQNDMAYTPVQSDEMVTEPRG